MRFAALIASIFLAVATGAPALADGCSDCLTGHQLRMKQYEGNLVLAGGAGLVSGAGPLGSLIAMSALALSQAWQEHTTIDPQCLDACKGSTSNRALWEAYWGGGPPTGVNPPDETHPGWWGSWDALSPPLSDGTQPQTAQGGGQGGGQGGATGQGTQTAQGAGTGAGGGQGAGQGTGTGQGGEQQPGGQGGGQQAGGQGGGQQPGGQGGGQQPGGQGGGQQPGGGQQAGGQGGGAVNGQGTPPSSTAQKSFCIVGQQATNSTPPPQVVQTLFVVGAPVDPRLKLKMIKCGFATVDAGWATLCADWKQAAAKTPPATITFNLDSNKVTTIYGGSYVEPVCSSPTPPGRADASHPDIAFGEPPQQPAQPPDVAVGDPGMQHAPPPDVAVGGEPPLHEPPTSEPPSLGPTPTPQGGEPTPPSNGGGGEPSSNGGGGTPQYTPPPPPVHGGGTAPPVHGGGTPPPVQPPPVHGGGTPPPVQPPPVHGGASVNGGFALPGGITCIGDVGHAACTDSGGHPVNCRSDGTCTDSAGRIVNPPPPPKPPVKPLPPPIKTATPPNAKPQPPAAKATPAALPAPKVPQVPKPLPKQVARADVAPLPAPVVAPPPKVAAAPPAVRPTPPPPPPPVSAGPPPPPPPPLPQVQARVTPPSVKPFCEKEHIVFHNEENRTYNPTARSGGGGVCNWSFTASGSAVLTSASIEEQPSNGNLTQTGDYSFRYVPYPGFRGSDHYAIEVCGDSANGSGCTHFYYEHTVE
jgi:hypothetical protein